jgi:hypothetical protein
VPPTTENPNVMVSGACSAGRTRVCHHRAPSLDEGAIAGEPHSSGIDNASTSWGTEPVRELRSKCLHIAHSHASVLEGAHSFGC